MPDVLQIGLGVALGEIFILAAGYPVQALIRRRRDARTQAAIEDAVKKLLEESDTEEAAPKAAKGYL